MTGGADARTPAAPPDFAAPYEALTAWMRRCVEQHPELAELVDIGRSYEGRTIWMLVLTDRRTGAPETKPGIWVHAAIHACEPAASAVAIEVVRRLLDRDGPAADDVLARCTGYVVPRLNPDGVELLLHDSRHHQIRSSTRPLHEPSAGGFLAGDIDGDGIVRQMRWPDERGLWRPHPDDPRLMIGRAPGETDGITWYQVVTEGSDVGSAAAPSEPGRLGPDHRAQAFDLCRNFPVAWTPDPAHGTAPTSEPEVRAVVDAVLSRPNIGAFVCCHTSGRVLVRPSDHRTDDELPTDDLALLNEVGSWLTERNGYPVWSAMSEVDPETGAPAPLYGTSIDWAFHVRGLLAFTPELWDVVDEIEAIEHRAGERPEPPDPTRRHVGRPVEDASLPAIARWCDDEQPGRYIAAWRPFDHPQLGQVEIGGWDECGLFWNPPVELVGADAASVADWCLHIARSLPSLLVTDIGVEAIGSQRWRVTARVRNIGWLSTSVTTTAAVLGVVDGVRVALDGDDISVIGAQWRDLGQLAGIGSADSPQSVLCEWTVEGSAGRTVHVTASHPRAGSSTAEITLGAPGRRG